MNILICDDCSITRLFIRKILEGFSDTLIDEAETSIDCYNKLTSNSYSAIFLDIDLKDSNTTGFEIAEYIRKNFPLTQIVFATAHGQFALKAFDLDAADYMLKPFSYENVYTAISKIRKRLDKQSSQLKVSIKCGSRILLLEPNDLYFIESVSNKKAKIYTNQDIIEVNESLTGLEPLLPPCFMRCHQSFIINVNRVNELTPVNSRTYSVYFPNIKHTALLVRSKYEDFCSKLKGL